MSSEAENIPCFCRFPSGVPPIPQHCMACSHLQNDLPWLHTKDKGTCTEQNYVSLRVYYTPCCCEPLQKSCMPKLENTRGKLGLPNVRRLIISCPVFYVDRLLLGENRLIHQTAHRRATRWKQRAAKHTSHIIQAERQGGPVQTTKTAPAHPRTPVHCPQYHSSRRPLLGHRRLHPYSASFAHGPELTRQSHVF